MSAFFQKAEHPELWAFLDALRQGELLSGTVAAVERFGAFVALDDGPPHPVFPGVGFVTMPELSWTRFEDPLEIVRAGMRVTGEFLQFDTHNGEARMSLKALQPDPFVEFGARRRVGEVVWGTVTKLVPFGVFVHVESGVEGLVHLTELSDEPLRDPGDLVQVGDEIRVVITEIDLRLRRLGLSRRRAFGR